MSTLRVSNLQNEASANNQITLGTDGFAQINGVALPSAGPLSSRNLIVNGAMAVSQRGTTSTSTGYQTVDRFRTQVAGGTVTQSQQTLSSGDPYNEGFRQFFRATNTTTSSATNDQREIRYYVEAQDIAGSGWQYTSSTSYVILSYWVRSSVAGTYYNYVRSLDGTNTPSYTTSFTLSADTWLKVTKTIPGGTNLAFNNDNGLGFDIRWMIDLGTDFTGSGATLDTWRDQDDSQRTPDFGQDWANTTDATFDVTGVQLEVGEVATPFEHRSYGDELRRCQRYYQRITADTDNDVLCVGYSEGTSTSRGTVFLRTTMRVAPSAIDTTGTFSDYEVRCGTNNNCTNITIDRTTPDTVSCNFDASGMTDKNANLVRFRVANSYLGMSAEL